MPEAENKIDVSAPEVQAAINAAIAEQTAGLVKKNTELLGEVKKFKGALAQFEGVDLEEIKTIKQKMVEQEAEAAKLKAKGGDVEELLKRHEAEKQTIITDWQKRHDAKEKELNETRSAFETTFRESAVAQAIAEAKGNAVVLMPHIMQRVKAVVKEGKYSLDVIDTDGNPRIAPQDGKSFTLQMLIDELRNDNNFAPLFPQSSGGGAGGNRGAGGGNGNYAPGGLKRSAMSATEKSEFITKHGGEKFRQLPA